MENGGVTANAFSASFKTKAREGGTRGRGRQRGGLWMAKKRYARVGAASFPAGDLELVIKYKEPCFASSHPESARPLLPLLHLFRPRLLFLDVLLHLPLAPLPPAPLPHAAATHPLSLSSRLLASPFSVPGIQRGLYLIRDFIRFTSSRGLRVVELRANDRLSARLAKSMNSDYATQK